MADAATNTADTAGAITEAVPALKQVLDALRQSRPGVSSVSIFTPVQGSKSYANIEVAGYTDADDQGVINLAHYPHDPLQDADARLVDEHLRRIGQRSTPAYLSYIDDDEGQDEGPLLHTLVLADLPECYR